MEPIWSLGFMSGTSLDGVDAAWLRTDGETILEIGGGMTVPYPDDLRERIRSVLGQKGMTQDIKAIEKDLTLFHADVARQVLEQHPIDIIGFHGQTIFHCPPITHQLGDGELLSEETKKEVIYDFRSEDVANGGQGAPLVPIFHQAMLQDDGPIVVVNIGGVANITWIKSGHPLIACDTGPGGAILDDWVKQKTGASYDQDGQLGANGTPVAEILTSWMGHPYFAKPAPKSLDRNDFATRVKDMEGLSLADGAATLVEFTAKAIIRSLDHVPEHPSKIYVAGGGRWNKHLMNRLSDLSPCPVETVEVLNWNGDLLEAYAFAYLAARVRAGLPISFPTTTGVRHPTIGGKKVLRPS